MGEAPHCLSWAGTGSQPCFWSWVSAAVAAGWRPLGRGVRVSRQGGGPGQEHPILGGPGLIVLGRGPRRILVCSKLTPSWRKNQVHKDF